MSWWRDRDRLASFVTDLVRAELARIRPGRPLPLRPWADGLEFGEAGLGCDSLERLALAAALGRALRLDRSGLEDHLLVRRTLGGWVDLAELCLERHDDSVVFSTSGSTGLPKPCEHGLDSLQQEVDVLAALFAGRRRIVAAVPSHHIYGFLFTLLLPATLDVPVVRRLDRSTVGLQAELRPGDLVIGFPDFWSLAARSVARFPPDVAGVSSTAPLPDHLDAALAEAGLGRLVEIYGSSETAGVGWREAPSTAFALFPHWARSSEGDGLSRAHPDGSAADHLPQDHLLWTGDRSFRPDGRRDQAFQVGGVNVHPRHVEAVLARHPEVAEVAVRRMKPGEGDRVKAFIVPAHPGGDEADLARELDSWALGHLSPAERPKAFRFGSALPRDQQGKALDWDIDS